MYTEAVAQKNGKSTNYVLQKPSFKPVLVFHYDLMIVHTLFSISELNILRGGEIDWESHNK